MAPLVPSSAIGVASTQYIAPMSAAVSTIVGRLAPGTGANGSPGPCFFHLKRHFLQFFMAPFAVIVEPTASFPEMENRSMRGLEGSTGGAGFSSGVSICADAVGGGGGGGGGALFGD